MDARRREEVQQSSTSYSLLIKLYGVANNPILRTLLSLPVISAVGNLTKIDFLNGEIAYYNNIEIIELNEVKLSGHKFTSV